MVMAMCLQGLRLIESYTLRDHGVQKRTLLAGGALENVLLIGIVGDEAVHRHVLVLADAVAARHGLQIILHTHTMCETINTPSSTSTHVHICPWTCVHVKSCPASYPRHASRNHGHAAMQGQLQLSCYSHEACDHVPLHS